MNKIFLSLLVLIFFPFCVTAASVAVTPAVADKNVGAVFNLSVKALTAGEKVCVVKGTFNLDKLSCQSINVLSGIMSIVSPNCSSSNFTLGIPGCAVSDKNLFTILVKGESVGQASINFSEVKVYGDGAIISNQSAGGVYNINEAVAVAPVSQKNASNGNSATESAPVLFDVSAQPVVKKSSGNNIYTWLILIFVLILLLLAVIIWEVLRRIKKKI